ncbi:MAG: hypothetical protein SWZ49_30390 [Cyanobacteriota bacterium]|nr:hypothetical protein [Cyanobacteriota bacterium]
MYEAQTPDDGANIKNLNSVDSSRSSQGTTNPFNSILAGEYKARELLLLAPAREEELPHATVDYPEEETATEHIDTEVEIINDSNLNHSPQFYGETDLETDSDSDWVAEPNVEQQRIVNTEFDKLLKLNEELRNANNQLYGQAEELTNALSESEAALQQQRKRSTVAESMLKQHAQELNAAQAQIQSLFEQLENSVQNVQRQESLAESYRGQLELNQQRLAQLERECALVQNKYSEQTRLLSQSENACRELRTRLKRQQRQTLQFKAALEKSLETSVPGYDTPDDSDSNFLDIKNNSRLNKPLRTQAISSIQSIQPWSAPPESYKTQNDFWEETVSTSPRNDNESSIPEESSTWEFTANPNIAAEHTSQNPTEDLINNDLVDSDSSADLTTNNQVISPLDSSTNSDLTTDNQVIPESESPIDSDLTTVNQVVPPSELSANSDLIDVNQISSPESSDLEEQLDTVIQKFFASQTEPVSPQSHEEQDTETSEDVNPTWTTIIEPRGTNNHDVVNVETHQNSYIEDEQTVSFTSSMNDIDNDETQDYWEEVSHFPAFDLSENAPAFEITSDTDNDTSSPSPLIYPKRPPKGRKSLASVELPKFPQKDGGENG